MSGTSSNLAPKFLSCALLAYAAVACSGGTDTPRGDTVAGAGASAGGLSAGGASAGVSGGGTTPVGTSGSTAQGGAGAPAGGAEAGGGGAAAGGSTGGGGAAAGGSGGSGGMAGGPGGTDGPAIKCVMYLPNWSGSFNSWAQKLSFDKMTHLDLAFGTLKGQNDWSLGASDDDVKAIAAAGHAKGVKVMVSIGGADDDLPIINGYGDAGNIDAMVNNLDAFVNRLDLDGVDVDLERGNGLKASGNFPQFLSKLIGKLRPEGKVVSTALAQYIIEDTGDDPDTTFKWLSTYDFINLMIYNPNMSTYTKELDWWTGTRKIPKNKLTWGMEFSNKTSVDYAKQLTTASKDYGGIMAWELSQPTASTLWPAVQSAL